MTRKEKKTEQTIGEHVDKLMKHSKRDLAVMYPNLGWCFNEIAKTLRVKSKK